MRDNIDRFWDIILLVTVAWSFTLIMPKYSPLFIAAIILVLVLKFTLPNFEKQKNYPKKKKRDEYMGEE